MPADAARARDDREDALGPLGRRTSAPPAARGLSAPSRAFDVGDKGFLSESEQQLRNYDTNDDGEIDINEMKKLIGDLRETQRQRSAFMKFAGAAAGCFALATLGNIGLAWATLVLTRRLDVQGSSLVGKGGEKLNVKARGEKVSIALNPVYAQRRLAHHRLNRHLLGGSEEDRAAYHAGASRILEETHFYDLGLNCAEARDIFEMFVLKNGVTYELEIDGNTYTGTLHHANSVEAGPGLCARYEGVVAGRDCNMFRIDCPEGEDESCRAYRTATGELRQASEEKCDNEHQENTKGWLQCLFREPC